MITIIKTVGLEIVDIKKGKVNCCYFNNKMACCIQSMGKISEVHLTCAFAVFNFRPTTFFFFSPHPFRLSSIDPVEPFEFPNIFTQTALIIVFIVLVKW